MAAAAVVAVFAPLLAPYDPNATVGLPSSDPSSMHLLGTDALGRDVLSRIIFGTRIDLPVAVVAVLLPTLLGSVLGCVAGYRGGWVDSLVMGVSNVVQAFPIYVLLIALIFSLGPGLRSVIIAYAIIDRVVYARLARGEVLRIKTLDYIQAAEAAGIPPVRVLRKHILPNVFPQIVVYASSDTVIAIATIATFSYFGLGVAAPTAEWGSMVAAAQPFLLVQPMLSVFPAIAIMVLGLGFALIGDGLGESMQS